MEEQTLGRMPILGPIELLAWAAGLTERIRLGCAVLLTGLGSPLHFAKSITTLDHLSGGRLTVGLGLGEREEYERFGLHPESRARRFVEGIELMRRLWTEPRASFAGEFWQVNGIAMEPKPVQRPHPPLFFGGRSLPALRRAVEMGDGFIGAGASSTIQFASQVERLRGLLREAGRNEAALPVGKRVYIHVDPDRELARERLHEWFAVFYEGLISPDEVAVWGDAAECAEGLRRVLDAGAQFLILNPVADEFSQMERLALEVTPRLRTAS